MSDLSENSLRRMIFVSPENRRESLWVEELGRGEFRVLSVPVWVYGISVGTVVAAVDLEQDPLSFQKVVRPSAGGTVRFVAPSGVVASELYKAHVVPDARQLGLFIGPATFFNPRLVAVHLRFRTNWWPEVGSYLDGLVNAGIVDEWEVADPDEYATDHPSESIVSGEFREVLMHPLPFDGITDQHVS